MANDVETMSLQSASRQVVEVQHSPEIVAVVVVEAAREALPGNGGLRQPRAHFSGP